MNNTLLDALTQQGVLINVSIRFWRARKKLLASDLGLNDTQIDDKLISLGSKYLIPRDAMKELARIEGRAHFLVEENTFSFLNGVGRYLPNPRLAEVTNRLEGLRGDFDHAKNAFLDSYADLRARAMYEWSEVAERLTRQPALLLSRIEAAFPQIEVLQQKYSFTVNCFQVTCPQVPQAELITAADQVQVIQAREAAARNAAGAIEASVREFIAESITTMREQTAQLCEEMLQTINGDSHTASGYVHQRTLNRLTRFIDHYQDLNVFGDQELSTYLENTRREFLSRSAEDYRDNDRARSRLVQGLATLRDKAREIARADTQEIVESFGRMGRRRFSLVA